MVFLYGALMFLALIGMMVCSKKQKTNPAMQPVAFVLLVVVVVSGFFLMKDMGVFGTDTASIMESENTFYSSQGEVIAKELKAKGITGEIVVIVDPTQYKNHEGSKMLVENLKNASKEEVTVVEVEIPEDFADQGMPVSMIVKAKDFDKIIAENKDAKAIVSMIGLPENAPAMKVWKMKEDVRPAVVLMSVMPIKGLDTLVANGIITGIIIPKPKADYESSAPSDLQEAFDVRYVFVDKDNLNDNKKYIAN